MDIAFGLPCADLASVVSLARRAEERGFAALAARQRPGEPDPLIVLAAAAAVTRRIRLEARYEPRTAADQEALAARAAELRRLAGHRVELVAGAIGPPRIEAFVELAPDEDPGPLRTRLAHLAAAGAEEVVTWASRPEPGQVDVVVAAAGLAAPAPPAWQGSLVPRGGARPAAPPPPARGFPRLAGGSAPLERPDLR